MADPNALARQVLLSLGEGRRPTDDQVFSVLEACNIPKTKNRKYVLRAGNEQTGVQTLTLGFLIPQQGCKKPNITKATWKFQDVCRLLCRWAFTDSGGPVQCTSLVVNKDYAAARHRDTSDHISLTIVRAVRPEAEIDAEGGELLFWPMDEMSGRKQLQALNPEDATVLHPLKKFEIIKGGNAHEVNPFQGTRFSIVFFNGKGYSALKKAEHRALVAQLESLGFCIPEKAYLARMLNAYLEEELVWETRRQYREEIKGAVHTEPRAQVDEDTETPAKKPKREDATPEKRTIEQPQLTQESEKNKANKQEMEVTDDERKVVRAWLIAKGLVASPKTARDYSSGLKGWIHDEDGKVKGKAISRHDNSPAWHKLMAKFAESAQFRKWHPKPRVKARSHGNEKASGSGPVPTAPTDPEKREKCMEELQTYFESEEGGGHTPGSAHDKALAAMKMGNDVISPRYQELLARIRSKGAVKVVLQLFEKYSC